METLYGKTGVRETFEAGYGAIDEHSEVHKKLREEAYQRFLMDKPHLHSAPLTTKEVVRHVSDYFNSFSSKETAFITEMERQHRTLQQSFTKAVLMWLEHLATEDYHVDSRNEGSQTTARKLMEGWRMLGEADETQTYGSKPSQWLRMI